MIYTTNISDIIKEVYDEPVIGEIDLADIKKMLSEFSYEKCKINLNLNDILKKP